VIKISISETRTITRSDLILAAVVTAPRSYRDISDYVTKMRSLNVDVGWAEHTWQGALMKGLNQEMFYRFGIVKKPTDDDDFEDLLMEVGHSLEQSKRDAKALGKKAPLLFGQKDDKERKKN